VISPDHDGKLAITVALPCRDLVLRNRREKQPAPAASAGLTDKHVTLVRCVVHVVTENDLDPALESLTIGVLQVEGEGILGIDLPGVVDHDSVNGGQATKISGPSHVGIVGVLVCLPGCLLTVSSPGLLLKSLIH
jgi:hypothetical protein